MVIPVSLTTLCIGAFISWRIDKGTKPITLVMRTLDSDWLFLRFYRHKTKLGVNCFVKSINLEKGMVMFAKINCGNILYIFIFFSPTSSHLPLDKEIPTQCFRLFHHYYYGLWLWRNNIAQKWRPLSLGPSFPSMCSQDFL